MSDNYEYLNEERIKLWKAVRYLEQKLDDLVKNTPLQLQSDARGQLNKASGYVNRIIERQEEAETKIKELNKLALDAQGKTERLSQELNDINEKYNHAKEQFDIIQEAYDTVCNSNEEWNEQAASIDKNFDAAKGWIDTAKTQAESIKTIHDNCESTEKKINGLLKQSSEKKQEIHDIYDEIFGYDIPDGDGKHEEGLVDELGKSYDELDEKIKKFKEELDSFKEQKEKEYTDFINYKKEEHDSIHSRIKDLLPGAMTAGLSHAYNDQCNAEKTERERALKAYYTAIAFMTVFAFVPFVISCFLRYHLDKTWLDIIQLYPQIVCVIVPLYLPALWVAFSSSRKVNLSKRLIEEYAHKVALARTFQGLEEQISGLKNSETAMELKVKLLYNLVSVSAENPGKLISNYNKADNPLVEFLDKSIAISEVWERLSNIPGISSIAKILLEKEKAKQNKIIETAVKDVEELREEKRDENK